MRSIFQHHRLLQEIPRRVLSVSFHVNLESKYLLCTELLEPKIDKQQVNQIPDIRSFVQVWNDEDDRVVLQK